MPHVVFEGRVDLGAWSADFQPLILREGGDVLRADRVYLDRSARSALVEALVVEAGRKLPFYVRVSVHDRGSTTVRVDPATPVERSPGVRTLVAHLARLLLDRTPGARVSQANVELPPPGHPPG